MNISLKLGSEINSVDKNHFLKAAQTIDCFLSYLFFLSELSNEFEGYCFHISGFGEDAWPLEDSTELVIFLEQLPEIVISAKKEVAFVVEFFEQGFERELRFWPQENEYMIEYFDFIRSTSVIGVETLPFENTKKMFENCLGEFERVSAPCFNALNDQMIIGKFY